MKQATVSYMKFSKELTKYNVNVATRTLRLDFKCVHAEDNWTCWKKCFPASDKIIKQFIADANITFQGTRGARHGAQPWQKFHYLAKELMRKIGKKGIYSSIYDRFQNDEVFHASQLQHNWTKEWCEYLDYITTIELHELS